MASIRALRVLVAFLAVAALVVSTTALAARGEPKKELTPADQKRAKAMVLRKSDLPGASVLPTTPSNFYCAAVDESDLTITGESMPLALAKQPIVLLSWSDIYKTVADASESLGRATTPGGHACFARSVRVALGVPKAARVTVRRMPLPRLSDKSYALRATLEFQGERAYFDLILLQRSRAQSVLGVVTATGAPRRAEQIGYARLIAQRMKTAMRGA